MNTSMTAVVLLCLGVCLGGLLLPGCKKPLTPEAVACKARITTFRSVVGFDDVKMLRDALVFRAAVSAARSGKGL